MTDDDKKAAQYRKEANSGGTDAPVPQSVTQDVEDKKAAAQAATAPTTKSDMGSSPLKAAMDFLTGGGKAAGGKISSASSRADGIAERGKTKGKVC